MDIWMDWTKYESSYPYGDPRALGMYGDSGRGYGMYGFDYRYGLIPFMQICIQHNPTLYADFQPFINMGVGNPNLVMNQTIISLFQYYANNYTADFLYCQNQAFISQYLQPAIAIAQQYNIANLNNPYILGALASMAIRDGAYDGSRYGEAIRAMVGLTNITDQLYACYTVFENYYIQQGDDRWYRQLAEELSDMANGEGVVDIETGYIPPEPPEPPEPPLHFKKKRLLYSPFTMRLLWRRSVGMN